MTSIQEHDEANVQVTFRYVPIDEDLLHYIRRRARGLSPVWVLLLARGREVGVRVTIPKLSVDRADPSGFIAVRNAFDLLEAVLERASIRPDQTKEQRS